MHTALFTCIHVEQTCACCSLDLVVQIQHRIQFETLGRHGLQRSGDQVQPSAATTAFRPAERGALHLHLSKLRLNALDNGRDFGDQGICMLPAPPDQHAELGDLASEHFMGLHGFLLSIFWVYVNGSQPVRDSCVCIANAFKSVCRVSSSLRQASSTVAYDFTWFKHVRRRWSSLTLTFSLSLCL